MNYVEELNAENESEILTKMHQMQLEEEQII
jgi:hypothetical protein